MTAIVQSQASPGKKKKAQAGCEEAADLAEVAGQPKEKRWCPPRLKSKVPIQYIVTLIYISMFAWTSHLFSLIWEV